MYRVLISIIAMISFTCLNAFAIELAELENEKQVFQKSLQDFGEVLHAFSCVTYVPRLGDVAMYPTFTTKNYRDNSFNVKFGVFTVGHGTKTIEMRIFLNGARSGEFQVSEMEGLQLLSYTKNGETLAMTLNGENLYSLAYQKEASVSKFYCIRIIE